jgi:hypothetical protein
MQLVTAAVGDVDPAPAVARRRDARRREHVAAIKEAAVVSVVLDEDEIFAIFPPKSADRGRDIDPTGFTSPIAPIRFGSADAMS